MSKQIKVEIVLDCEDFDIKPTKIKTAMQGRYANAASVIVIDEGTKNETVIELISETIKVTK